MKQKGTDSAECPRASCGSWRPWAWSCPQQRASRGAVSPSAGAQLPWEAWGRLEPGHGHGHGHATDTAVLRALAVSSLCPRGLSWPHPPRGHTDRSEAQGWKDGQGPAGQRSHLGPEQCAPGLRGHGPQRLLGMAASQPTGTHRAQRAKGPTKTYREMAKHDGDGRPPAGPGLSPNPAVLPAVGASFTPSQLGTLHLRPSSRSGSP